LGIALALLASVLVTDATAQMSDLIAMEMDDAAPISLLRASHDSAEVEIDGRIDETIWQRVEPISNYRVVKPDTLAEVPYKTELRIFYTENGLYVSFDMEQPAETIIQRSAPRDSYDVNRDSVSVTLDTSGNGRYGYWMSLALGDGEMDGTILPERQYGRDWDGAWVGATSRTEKGWVAEFYMPWSQMAMPKEEGLRTIAVYSSRQVAHLDERWGWPGLTETQPRFMSAMQPLQLDRVDPRQQWSIFPYASTTLDRIDDNVKWKAGTDLFWRPSTNFQLTATINPDFGSVESDDVVVNLTADETFFPEKRLFFLEGQEIFNIGGDQPQFQQQPLRIVNTRRIGGRPRDLDLPDDVELSDRQELRPADIIAAAKATGQIGAVRYGILTATEDDSDYIASDDQFYSMEGRDFGVLRFLYEDSKGAAYRGIGWISTLTAHPESDATVHSADVHYLTTSGKWNLNGQVVFSDIDEDGSGYGYLADANYSPRQGERHEFRVTILDDKIDVNDLGFQRRNDINDYQYRFHWNKSGLEMVRDFRLSPFVRYEENGEGYSTFHGYGVSGNVTLNNLHRINGFVGHFPDQYDDRNSFDNGTFAVKSRTFSDLRFTTNPAKSVSVFARIGARPEDLYGTSIETQFGITWRPLDNLNLQLDIWHKDYDGWLLHQEDENFTTFTGTQWQPKLNFDFYPTSKQQIRLALQWVGIRAFEDRFFVLPDGSTELVEVPKPPGETDDFSISQLNFQVRYRWQIAPLSDLFIVYTKGDRQRTDLMSFDELFRDNWNNPLGDFLVIKLRYLLGS
jgi:hypothetical protein